MNKKPVLIRASGRSYATPRPADKPEPPACLSAAGLAAFEVLVAALPPGAAAKSDSIAIGLAAELLAEFRLNPVGFPNARLAVLRQFMNDFALTPSARRRLELKEPPGENPFAECDRLRRT